MSSRDLEGETADDLVYPSDPLGLLRSIPELELFLSDRRVRGAIERGRPSAVYRALARARLWRRFPAHRETLDMLLRSRRLFVEPVRGAPALFTYNGVGLSLYGEAERGDEGAYVATHYLVFFFVPIFPLGSYLTATAGPRSYRFFGRVPFDGFHGLWNRLIVLGIVGAVLFGIGSTAIASRFVDVDVLNGLPVPIVATVGGHRVEVPPGERRVVTGDVGPCELVATTTAGTEIDRRATTLTPGNALVAWNVAGSAALYREEVYYGPPRLGEGPEPRIYCGEALVTLDEVDDLFVEPPERIDVGRRHSATRSHVDVADVDAFFCPLYLLERARPAVARGPVEAFARAIEFEPETTALLARNAAALDAPEIALDVLETARARHDESLAVHLEIQETLVQLDRRTEALAAYAARAAEHDDADSAYLAERLDSSPGGGDRWRALAERFPDHVRIGTACAMTLCQEGRFDEGLARFEAIEQSAPDHVRSRADVRARCLVAAGSPDAARAVLEDAARAEPEFEFQRVYHSYVHAALEPRERTAEAPSLFERYATEEQRAEWLLYDQALRGLPVDVSASEDEMLTALVRTAHFATTDPESALESLGTLRVGARTYVPAELQALLLGAAVVYGWDRAEADLAARSSFGPERGAAMVALVRDGTESDLTTDLSREVRAALAFARSRMPGLSPEESATWLDAAHRLDDVPFWIPRAEEGWPAP